MWGRAYKRKRKRKDLSPERPPVCVSNALLDSPDLLCVHVTAQLKSNAEAITYRLATGECVTIPRAAIVHCRLRTPGTGIPAVGCLWLRRVWWEAKMSPV